MRRTLLLVMTIAGCGGGGRAAKKASDEPPPEAIKKVTENGPVKATVVVWPPSPTLGDPIHLRLTIEAQVGVTVSAPFEDEGLGRFEVIGWTHETKRRDDGAIVETQNYTLDAPGSGKQRIPPLHLEVVDGRAGAGGSVGPNELLTDEIPIEIAAIDPARAGEPLSEAKGRLPVTVGGTRWWLVVMGVLGGLGAIVGGAIGYRRWKRVVERRVRVSAYQLAVQRLAELEQKGAPTVEAADAWFVALSGIVRRYLEGRFGVRAPELTTEEFLREARRAAGLNSEHRELLAAFLERCDRVKFAGYRPDADESLATLKAARAFVEDTRLREREAA